MKSFWVERFRSGDQGLEDWSQLIGGAADPIATVEASVYRHPEPCLASSSPPRAASGITM